MWDKEPLKPVFYIDTQIKEKQMIQTIYKFSTSRELVIPNRKQAIAESLYATFIAFIVAGVVCGIPYFLLSEDMKGYALMQAVALIFLFLPGPRNRASFIHMTWARYRGAWASYRIKRWVYENSITPFDISKDPDTIIDRMPEDVAKSLEVYRKHYLHFRDYLV